MKKRVIISLSTKNKIVDLKKKDFIDFITKKLNPKRYEFCHDSFTNDDYFIYSSELKKQLQKSAYNSTFDVWERVFDLYYKKINGSPVSTGDTSVWIDSVTKKTIPKFEIPNTNQKENRKL